jgi:hypothetical protein
MTTPRDPDALLAAYLADGMTELPDRVVDAVLHEAHRTRQRAGFGSWRTSTMFKIAFAAVLLLTGLVGGAALIGTLNPSRFEPAPGTWADTGRMQFPHVDHKSIRLDDGRVLVMGWGPRSELYDPRTGTWTETGDLVESRASFAAALLGDGRVLVVGGTGDDAEYVNGMPVSLTSAEVYDPATGEWTAISSMAVPRAVPTATLLPNGTVLVAGGSTGGVQTNTAEVFDPRSGTWTKVGSMAGARSAQTATLLRNGTVLIAGGSDVAGVPSAEVYDPSTRAFTLAGSMQQPRRYHTATLLPDGRVLVAGGSADGMDGLLRAAEIYDPGANAWTATASMRHGRDAFTATLLLDGTVLVTGGAPPATGERPQSSAELFDPATGTWLELPAMNVPRHYHAATRLDDGSVLVTGGTEEAGNSAVRYLPGPIR